jgi:hypothetical protein
LEKLDWRVDAWARLSIDGCAGHRGLQPDLRRRRQPEPTRAQPADRPDRPGPRHDAEKIAPRRPSGPPPTEAQKKELAAALDVSVQQLDTVMEKYRPDRLRQR